MLHGFIVVAGILIVGGGIWWTIRRDKDKSNSGSASGSGSGSGGGASPRDQNPR